MPIARPACMFCGSTEAKTSKEHVLPQHWKETFPGSTGRLLRRRVLGVPQERRVNHVTPYDQKVPQVCEECNRGWMRLMDEAVKPLVYDLSWGKTRVIPAESVDLLGTWCTKVSLVRTHADRDASQQASVEMTRRFFMERRPMMPGMIQVGRSSPERSLSGHSSRQVFDYGIWPKIVGDRTDYCSVASFQIGAFFFQAGLPTPSPWSAEQATRMLAACRRHVPFKLMTLRPGRESHLPESEISEEETVVMLEEVMYDAGVAPNQGGLIR